MEISERDLLTSDVFGACPGERTSTSIVFQYCAKYNNPITVRSSVPSSRGASASVSYFRVRAK